MAGQIDTTNSSPAEAAPPAISLTQKSLPASSRRTMLGAIGALGIAAGVITNRAFGAALEDDDIVRVCAEHIRNLDVINKASDTALEGENNPLWIAYDRSRDAVSAAKPKTLRGIIAKIEAAKAQALVPSSGEERPYDGPACEWAWDIANDVLRLHGQGVI